MSSSGVAIMIRVPGVHFFKNFRPCWQPRVNHAGNKDANARAKPSANAK